MATLDKLLNQLNGTGLQQKDMPLFQVISELIKRLKALDTTVSGISSGTGGSPVINNITNITQMLDMFSDSGGGEEPMIVPGPAGTGGGGTTTDVTVPTYIALNDTFSVAVYKQALFEMTIDVEGILDVTGFLVQVD